VDREDGVASGRVVGVSTGAGDGGACHRRGSWRGGNGHVAAGGGAWIC
jgi:hypothetical protein